jgi:hypothetical protein
LVTVRSKLVEAGTFIAAVAMFAEESSVLVCDEENMI